jgi:hypothetical protein
VQRVRSAEFTMFLHFDSVGIVFLVFLRVVVALLAGLASERDFNSHSFSAPPILYYLTENPSAALVKPGIFAHT